MSTEVSRPLQGPRINDCATIFAAPLACQILGGFRADVIKIEHPDRPDAIRGHGESIDGLELWRTQLARNKRTFAPDLGVAAGAAIFMKIVKTPDVVVENFRLSTLET